MKLHVTLTVALCLLYCQLGLSHQRKVPETWRLVDANGRFSFFVPADLQKTDTHGIDSYVEEYKSPTILLGFDYGQYSNSLTNEDGDLEYNARKTNIDGRVAKVVTYTFKAPVDGFQYFAGVYFSDVGAIVRGFQHPKLSMGISCKTRADQEIALDILKSIKFPPLPNKRPAQHALGADSP